MERHARLGSMVTGLMLLALSLSASALDYKVFAGSECQFNNPPTTGVSYYSTGVYNGTGATQWITCPVVRDRSFNTDGVWVRAAATVVTSCILDNTQLNGTLGTWIGFATGAGAYGAWANLATTGNSTPYSVLCGLPNAARFTAYQTAENEPTDAGN